MYMSSNTLFFASQVHDLSHVLQGLTSAVSYRDKLGPIDGREELTPPVGGQSKWLTPLNHNDVSLSSIHLLLELQR